MSFRTLIFLYAWRVRTHPLQEALAGVGIAVGVALLFAVQVSNASVTGSGEQLVEAIAGRAQMEVAARDDQGFDARLLSGVRGISGVQAAAPTFERRALIHGPGGDASLILIGTDESLAGLGGTILQSFPPRASFRPHGGLLLPDRLAHEVGVHAADTLRLKIAGHSVRVRVVATPGADQIGPLTDSGVAFAPLGWVQRLVGMPHRISRAFVRVRDGREQTVVRQLERISAGRLNVDPAESTVRRLTAATGPNDNSTILFATIGVLLFAFNAMLLTVPERRRFVVELRTQGFTPAQVVGTLVFQAVLLGLVASAVGLGVGDALFRGLFGSIPIYLSFTFPVGVQRVVPPSAILIAVGAGVGASVLAASRPFADLRRARAVDAVYREQGDIGEDVDATLRQRLLVIAGTLTVVAATIAITVPGSTMLAVALLAAAVLCTVPMVFDLLVRLMDVAARRLKRNMLVVALVGAQSTMTRSIAGAAIVAMGVFGTVTLGGARQDLIHGLFAGYTDHMGTADVWVTTAGRSLTTDSFEIAPAQLSRLRRDPMLASVRVYQGSMYDLGQRRIWVIARPRDDSEIIPPSQLVHGDPQRADAHMRETGWISLSTALAEQYGVGVGDAFSFPTPTGPHRFRVAAITTNLSWGPGAVILNTRDYRRAWNSAAPSAIEINTRPGVTPTQGRGAAERVLGRNNGYDIQTAGELEREFRGVLLDGLARLREISLLMLFFASVALATAFGTSTWHRRWRLAAYKMQGFDARQVRRILFLEAFTVLTLGAALGAIAGFAGHLLCDRWLELTTGFPAPFTFQFSAAITSVGPMIAVAMLLIGALGYLAARVPPGLTARE